FEESIRLREQVADLFKQDKERSFPYREALATTFQKAGFHASEYEKRKEYLVKVDKMLEQLLKERPTSRNVRLRLSLNTKTLGELEYNFGKLAEKNNDPARAKQHNAEAAKHYTKLNEISRRLAVSDDLLEGIRDYSRSFYTLGLMEKLNGQPQK